MTDHQNSSAGSKDAVNYAEILRLHRRFRRSDSEPLWKVFVRVGHALERHERGEAAVSVARERAALEDRERRRAMPFYDRSDWPKDGFINDID
jgi:hypothetical protein